MVRICFAGINIICIRLLLKKSIAVGGEGTWPWQAVSGPVDTFVAVYPFRDELESQQGVTIMINYILLVSRQGSFGT